MPSHPLKIAIYADGAHCESMLKQYHGGVVSGFTTNPTLVAKAGVQDYARFAQDVLKVIKTAPISFEVFSDDFSVMEREARLIYSWGKNVNVKIPIINTQGHSSLKLIRTLLNEKMKLNVTALFTQNQLDELRNILKPEDDVLVSIFAGRIADTGVDPLPLVKKAVQDFQPLHGSKILWASTREVFNVYQANEAQCHIITCPDGIIQQLKLYGKSLSEYSLETVKGFYQDIQTAGLKLMTHSEFMD